MGRKVDVGFCFWGLLLGFWGRAGFLWLFVGRFLALDPCFLGGLSWVFHLGGADLCFCF